MVRKLSDDEANELERILGQKGQHFKSQKEAEKYYNAQKENDFKILEQLNKKFPDLQLNYRAKSLVRLEQFYFKCYVDKAIHLEIIKEKFELLMTQYMRQVFVNLKMAEWVIMRNPFSDGNFELGLKYGYGSCSTDHYAEKLDNRPNNINREYLYKYFMDFVPSEYEDEVQ